MQNTVAPDAKNTPSYWADQGDSYDCTGFIGPLFRKEADAAWPMYSYDRPAYIVWNAIAGDLYKSGWSDKRIKDWLQSKGPRWALDGELSAMLEDAAVAWAKKHITEG